MNEPALTKTSKRCHRVLQEFGFAGDWAKGEPVNLQGLDDIVRHWKVIETGSIAELIFNELCPQMNDG